MAERRERERKIFFPQDKRREDEMGKEGAGEGERGGGEGRDGGNGKERGGGMRG